MGFVVRRYIDFLILLIYLSLLALYYLFFAAASLHLCSFFTLFFRLFLCNIANITQRKFNIIQKSRLCRHGDIANYVDKHVDYESRGFQVRGTKTK